MLKILLATPFGGIEGGISRWASHIMNYYNSIESRDVEVDIFSMSRSQFVDYNSSMLSRVISGIKDYFKIIRNLKTKIEEKQYDVLHLTSSASISLLKDIYILKLSKTKNIKTIVHFRFGRIPELSQKCNWEWKLLTKVINLSYKTIVIDQASYRTLQQAGFSNIEILPNPVAPIIHELLYKNKNLTRIPRRILFTGHVIKTKGIYELITACKQLDNIELRIVGHIEEQMKKELESLTNNGKWITITGAQNYENVIQEMLTCDIFVLPTYTEGFPNVILEAMACGCAIITTTVGAIPEMLAKEGNKEYGILIPPKDYKPLYNGIKFMLENDSFKQECQKNVISRVNERYNMPAIWSKMIQIWNS